MKTQLKTIIILIGLFMIVTPQPSRAQNTNTILILPFDVQADTKYDFLRPAIADMLFTRLSAPGRTLIVEKHAEQPGMSPAKTISLADAIQMGQQKGADYIVTGSIILQDDVISTNADFIGTDGQKTLVMFTQEGEVPGDIISQIDNFTAQVNADIFNPGAYSNEQTPQSDVPDEIHQHPEKMVIPEVPSDKRPDNEPTHSKPLTQESQSLDNR